MERTVHILLADDHAGVRGQLQALVDAQPDMTVVGVAANGREAVREALALRPDVVVMDLSMPELNGVEAMAQLHERDPGIRVLALTSHRDPSYVAAVQAAGGRGYVVKQSAATLLLEAIRRVAAGAMFEDPTLAEAPGLISPDAPLLPDLPPDALSATERAVLQSIARGLTMREVAGELGIDVAGVVTARERGMATLGLQGRVALVRYAMRHGWQ
jgi:DNA-binding NarL/FixJ family response regulator